MNQEPEFDPTIESELRQIKPAQMDEVLLERISHAATDNSPVHQTSSWRSNRWLWLIPFTATAAIVLALTLSPNKTNEPINLSGTIAAKPTDKSSEEESIELFPIRKNNQVVDAVNEGIIQIDGRRPYRSVRMQVIDSYEWAQPNGSTRVQYQVPREERFLVPVDIY